MPARACLRWLPNPCSLAIVALIAANYFSPFGDLDYTWQIRTGEIIVRTGNLQPPDQFSYTIAGQDLPDFEWLYEVTLWVIWDHLGYGGLKLLRTLLVAATLVLVAWRLRVARIRWHGVAFALTLAVAALAPAWNLRPLYCTTLGLLVVSGWLHDHCNGRKPLSWWLPVVMLVWSNCHPAVITGQALLLGAICWEWLNRWLRVNVPMDDFAIKRLTIIGGVALLASFICPNPIDRLLYPFSPDLTHPVQRVFVEMQPLYNTLLKTPYTSVLIYFIAGLVTVSIFLRFRYYRGWEIMLLLGLTALANTAARAAQDWMLVMLAVGWPQVIALLRHAALRDRSRALVAAALRCDGSWKRLWISPILRFQCGWVAAVMVLLTVVSFIPPLAQRMPIQEAVEWPNGAATFLLANNIQGCFFGPPDFGAYVTWRLGKSARCYTDTRGFFFPPRLLEDSHYLPQLGPDWRNRLDRVLNDYATDYFLLETTGPRGELWRRLQPMVGSEVVYLDEKSVVLSTATVRRGVKEMDYAARRENAADCSPASK